MMPPFSRFGIDPGRTLTAKQLGKVRARFLRASMRPAHAPDPDLSEVRWDDGYRFVYVDKGSGLLACGFMDPLFDEHHPELEDKNWAIYSRIAPSANSLLGAIAATILELPTAVPSGDEW